MLPILFRIGPIEIPSFGAMLAVGILLAWLYFRKQFPPEFDQEALSSLVTYAVLVGLLSSRLNYIAEHTAQISSAGDFFRMLASRSGLTVFGGWIGGTLFAIYYALRRKLPLRKILDAGAQSICIGYFFGRLGCQLAGDGDYGVPSDLPWAMAYPNGTVPTLERVHPTPVYEMILYIFLFLIVRKVSQRQPSGAAFFLFLVLAGTERFFIELLRTNRVVALGLTEAQIVSVLLIGGGIAGLLSTYRKSRTSPAKLP